MLITSDKIIRISEIFTNLNLFIIRRKSKFKLTYLLEIKTFSSTSSLA